jgi:4-amino-4-deoxy-L-arabinose transferase-like glycosyltransferase
MAANRGRIWSAPRQRDEVARDSQPVSEQDQSPFRVSGEPYREPRPDGLEEMRRARDRKTQRTAKILLVPFGFGVVVLCAFSVADWLIGLDDGIPASSQQVIKVAGFAIGLAIALYGAWRWLHRGFAFVLLIGALAVAGAWVRRDTATRRATWTEQAEQWCHFELGDSPPAAELAACVPRTIQCIARLEPTIGDPRVVIHLGHPCAVP